MVYKKCETPLEDLNFVESLVEDIINMLLQGGCYKEEILQYSEEILTRIDSAKKKFPK